MLSLPLRSGLLVAPFQHGLKWSTTACSTVVEGVITLSFSLVRTYAGAIGASPLSSVILAVVSFLRRACAERIRLGTCALRTPCTIVGPYSRAVFLSTFVICLYRVRVNQTRGQHPFDGKGQNQQLHFPVSHGRILRMKIIIDEIAPCDSIS